MSDDTEKIKAESETEDTFTKEAYQESLVGLESPTKDDPYFDFEEVYEITDDKELVGMKKKNKKSFLFDLIFYLILIFIVIYIIPNYVIQRTYVDGDSMQNTLFNKDQLYVEKLSYRFDALNRFDIIVFYPFGRKQSDYYVKRIIGLPGETVQIIGSDIYINGKVLKEHYGKDPIIEAGRAKKPIKLADDEYFVLGDNRTVSKDSRTTIVGNVKKENIGGRAIFRILPFSRFGTID